VVEAAMLARFIVCLFVCLFIESTTKLQSVNYLLMIDRSFRKLQNWSIDREALASIRTPVNGTMAVMRGTWSVLTVVLLITR
jgi:hypothetical protein